MAIPEFQSSITVRVPDEVRSELDTLSEREQKPLSRIVRAVIVDGLRHRMSSNEDYTEVNA
jgi:predicted DNA-binding protein